MRRSKSVLLITILALSLITIIEPVKANFSVSVLINDAYYADLDADGLEDDILVDISVIVSNFKVFTEVDLYLGITLPSGLEFWFLHEFTIQKSSYSGQVNFKYTLLNTALESGWYEANAVGFAQGEQFSYMDTLVFDPPGQQDGSDPPYGYASQY